MEIVSSLQRFYVVEIFSFKKIYATFIKLIQVYGNNDGFTLEIRFYHELRQITMNYLLSLLSYAIYLFIYKLFFLSCFVLHCIMNSPNIDNQKLQLSKNLNVFCTNISLDFQKSAKIVCI